MRNQKRRNVCTWLQYTHGPSWFKNQETKIVRIDILECNSFMVFFGHLLTYTNNDIIFELNLETGATYF